MPDLANARAHEMGIPYSMIRDTFFEQMAAFSDSMRADTTGDNMDPHASASIEELDDWAEEVPYISSPKLAEANPASATACPPEIPPSRAEPQQPLILCPHRDEENAFPAFTLRSSIFGTIDTSKERETVIDEVVGSQRGYSIIYTGPLLSEQDKVAWETALRLARQSSPYLNQKVRISMSEFLREMGVSYSGKAAGLATQALDRLNKCNIRYKLPNGHFFQGPLLTFFSKTTRLEFIVNGALAEVFQNDHMYRIKIERRIKLSRSIAKHLHDYYSTHDMGSSLPLGTIQEICGYRGSRKEFKRQLVEAMEELHAAAGDLIQSWSIVSNTPEGKRPQYRLSVVLAGKSDCIFPRVPAQASSESEKSARPRKSRTRTCT